MLRTELGNQTAPRVPMLAAVWFGVTLLLVFSATTGGFSLEEVAAQLCIVAVGGVFSLGAAFSRGFWSPACLFLLVIVLFHAGLAPFILFGLDPKFPRPDDYEWFYGEVGARSLTLVSLFCSVFVLAALLSALLSRSSLTLEQDDNDANEMFQRSTFAHFGAFALVAGIFYWTYITYSVGGLSTFFGSYVGFLNATSRSNLSLAYMMIGLGLGLVVMGTEWLFIRLSLAIFFIFSFVAFFLGLRGEVLFPLAVAASVMALRMRMPRGITVLSALIVVLSLINGAKNVRASGLAGDAVDLSAFTPLGALAELGSSLRVVAHTVIWHEAQGDPLRLGETYTVSLARLFESLFSPLGSPQAASDFRLMNSEVMERSGAIGGSIVAEAFHNFGLIGVCMAAALTGLMFGLFSVRVFSVKLAISYVCVAVPFFNHIRNSFVPVLPFIFVSGCLLVFVYVLTRRRSTRTST